MSRGQTAARQDESSETLGNGDGQSGRHEGSTAARLQGGRLHGHQVTTSVAFVGVAGCDGVGMKQLGEDFHSAKATHALRGRSLSSVALCWCGWIWR
jgi:hypothetical protein